MKAKILLAVMGAAVLVGLSLAGVASAELINIQTVPMGDVANAADTTGFGAVGYAYNIGKYEVTAGQYAEFLNAVAKTDTYSLYGLYDPNMAMDNNGCKITQHGVNGSYTYDFSARPAGTTEADWANRPVNYVSFWDACRFANWLNNGQANGDTETGAYTLTSAGISGNTIARNAGATWAVASMDEWYKAAYYKNGVYSVYANGTATAPAQGIDANYNGTGIWDGTINGSLEQNGSKDMMGNVWEWNEAIRWGTSRGILGGAYYDNSYSLRSSPSSDANTFTENFNIGFRVVQLSDATVPLPSAAWAGMVLLGVMGITHHSRRKHAIA